MGMVIAFRSGEDWGLRRLSAGQPGLASMVDHSIQISLRLVRILSVAMRSKSEDDLTNTCEAVVARSKARLLGYQIGHGAYQIVGFFSGRRSVSMFQRRP